MPTQPTPPASCHFCDRPSTQVLGIRPVCEVCAPVVKAIRAKQLETMLVFLRDAATRGQEEEQAA